MTGDINNPLISSQLLTRNNVEGAKNSKGAYLSLLRQRSAKT